VFHNKACSQQVSHFREKVTDGRHWQITQLMMLVYGVSSSQLTLIHFCHTECD